MVIAYYCDVSTLEALRNDEESGKKVEALIEHHVLQKQIAAARPDLLDLIVLLNPPKQKDLIWDSLDFKKGKMVKLTGKAKNNRHYQFVKMLQGIRGLTQVKLENPIYDKKKKMTSFTITFLYKNWSQKKRLSSLGK